MEKIYLIGIIAAVVVLLLVIVLVVRHTECISESIKFVINPNAPSTPVYCIPVPAIFGVASLVPTDLTFVYKSDGLYVSEPPFAIPGNPNPIAFMIVEISGEKYGYMVSLDDKGNPIVPTPSNPTITSDNGAACTMYMGPQFRGCGVISLKETLSYLDYMGLKVTDPTTVFVQYYSTGC